MKYVAASVMNHSPRLWEPGVASVTLVNHMGGDLTVVNAARVSFAKHKEELDERDTKLIHYLAEHKHMSPFRHVQLQFHVVASEVVARHWYKHQVGAAHTSSTFRESATVWNEVSGRYVKLDGRYHVPSVFRRQSESNRQASVNEPVEENDRALQIYEAALDHATRHYEELLNLGVCREQARMILPICFMTQFYWTASLEAVANFCLLRNHPDSQKELVDLAQEVENLSRAVSPVAFSALVSSLRSPAVPHAKAPPSRNVVQPCQDALQS